MIKWLKARSRQEKVMLIIAVMLLIGIILRWNWIKKEAADSFRNRFDKELHEQQQPKTLPEGHKYNPDPEAEPDTEE